MGETNCGYKPRVVSITTNKTSRPKSSNWWRQTGADSITLKETILCSAASIEFLTGMEYMGDKMNTSCFMCCGRPVVKYECNCCPEAQLFNGGILVLIWPKSCVPAQPWKSVHHIMGYQQPGFQCSNARQETALSDGALIAVSSNQRFVSIKRDSWRQLQGHQKA